MFSAPCRGLQWAGNTMHSCQNSFWNCQQKMAEGTVTLCQMKCRSLQNSLVIAAVLWLLYGAAQVCIRGTLEVQHSSDNLQSVPALCLTVWTASVCLSVIANKRNMYSIDYNVALAFFAAFPLTYRKPLSTALITTASTAIIVLKAQKHQGRKDHLPITEIQFELE